MSIYFIFRINENKFTHQLNIVKNELKRLEKCRDEIILKSSK